MKLALTKVQLLQQLHRLLTFSNSKPFLITSKSYIDFMERLYNKDTAEEPVAKLH